MISEVNRFSNYLDAAVEAALKAGAAIMEHYGSTEREAKSDGSPVTVADRASEGVILPALAALDPALPILSEEQAAAGITPPDLDGAFWCVDPLDGTKEFLNGSGEFTVCIGGVDRHRAVFGVLHAPALCLTFAGGVGLGAFRIGADGSRHPITVRRPPEDGRVALVSRSHRDGADLEARLKAAGVTAERSMGSAIKFGLIACGEADIYIRVGPTSEWDTAAGEAVLAAAGGVVEDLAGGPLAYGKPGFLNAGFVARGRST